MPSDETRRVLKLFGVAVTGYEDCVEKGASAEEINKAEGERDQEEKRKKRHVACERVDRLSSEFFG